MKRIILRIMSLLICVSMLFLYVKPVTAKASEEFEEDIGIDANGLLSGKYGSVQNNEVPLMRIAPMSFDMAGSLTRDGNMTLGGIIILFLSMIASRENIDISLTDLKNPDSPKYKEFVSVMDTATLNDRLIAQFKPITDTTMTLADFVDLGMDYSVWDFILPVEESPEIHISVDTYQYLYDFLVDMQGQAGLIPGTKYNSDETVIKAILNDLGYAYIADKSWLDGHKNVIMGLKHINSTEIYSVPCIYVTDGDIVQNYSVTTIGTVSPRSYGRMVVSGATYMYEYAGDRTTKQIGYKKNTTYNVFAITDLYKSATSITNDKYFESIYYTSMDMTYDGINRTKDRIEYEVKNSSHVYQNPALKEQTITANPYLVNEIAKIGTLDNVTTTDQAVKAIADADAQARANNSLVISNPIATVVEPDLGIFQGLLDALKEAMRWLFVPSQAKVQAFVNEATAKVENNSGLLSYPIELVIRFLNEVKDLGKQDCILVIPPIIYKGNVLYAGTSFNFTTYVKKSEFNQIYSTYIMITNFIMIVAVLNLAVKKGDEIIRGN